ncbi:Reverse transcriptase Ty1/copia-type domain-containing protein [Abeliophyllum distichum]|uniref:Reverse transcriptase Ty1/copia-type domain-containing protein n=1 Tax=Abeliophyllum distichum TaxID=126358 RepID=A0ABD1TJS8_9LAMI
MDNQNNIIPQFHQPETITPLENILDKFIKKTEQYMNKIETTLRNQGTSIKNLETQVCQIAVAISGRAPNTLSSNTEVNIKEHVKAITTRSGVQLLEINVNRSVANKEKVPSADEEHIEQTEQTTYIKESSVHDNFQLNNPSDPLEACIVHSQSTHTYSGEVEMCTRHLEANPLYIRQPRFEELGTSSTKHFLSIQQPPKIELKQLPSHLRYAYFGESSTLNVITANFESELEKKNYSECSENTRQLFDGLLLTSRASALHFACIKSS